MYNLVDIIKCSLFIVTHSLKPLVVLFIMRHCPTILSLEHSICIYEKVS